MSVYRPTYIDKKTGTDKHISARIVVLAASACETARLLLNSKSSQFPNGLAVVQDTGRPLALGKVVAGSMPTAL